MSGGLGHGAIAALIVIGACKGKQEAPRAPAGSASAAAPIADAAVAQPGDAAEMPAAQVVTCLPAGKPVLDVVGGGLRVCVLPGDDAKPTCAALDVATGTMTTSVEAPAPALVPAATVTDQQICHGGRCAPLGKRLAKAIADAQREGAPVTGTTDLAAVAVGHEPARAWSVAKDRPLAIKHPADASDPEYRVPGAVPVGALLLLEWVPCAGPCAMSRIATSSGKTVTDGLGGGGPDPRPLDAKRWALLTEYGGLHVFDDAGKTVAKIQIGPGEEGTADGYEVAGKKYEWMGELFYDADLVGLPDGRVAIAARADELLAIVDVGKAAVVQYWKLPTCTP